MVLGIPGSVSCTENGSDTSSHRCAKRTPQVNGCSALEEALARFGKPKGAELTVTEPSHTGSPIG